MYFHDPNQRKTRQLLPGVISRTFWGEHILMALVDLAPGAVIPDHSHPHEQAGTVISGEFTITISAETRTVHAGDIYIIPGGTVHSVQTSQAGAQVMEVFSPVREEYKY